MDTIQNNTQEQLKLLNVKYASIKKIAQSINYVSIVFLSVLYGFIFINDFWKLFQFVMNQFFQLDNEKQKSVNSGMKNKNEEIDFDHEHSRNLENYLEKAHMQLRMSIFKKRLFKSRTNSTGDLI